MTDNVLVPLPDFTLPREFPWKVRFISAVHEHLWRVRLEDTFAPPRFFGYYFRGEEPMGVTGSWTVALNAEAPLMELAETVEALTYGNCSIRGTRESDPDFVLIHDLYDGACWLWRFSYGMQFVMATEPMTTSE